jgi:hypothetical protein
MKTTILRAVPAALAVLVVAAGAATAAVALGATTAGEDAAPPIELREDDDGTSDQGSGDASVRPGDDDGTSDQGSGDDSVRPGDDDGTPDQGSRDDLGRSDDEPANTTIEDRPPRREVREDDDRREVREEVQHAGTQTYPVAQAGAVTVTREGGSLTVTGVTPSPGWTHQVERSSGYEVEVTFRSDGQRVDFDAEVEHDRVKTRVRER